MVLQEIAQKIPLLGSIVNALAVMAGTGVGLVFRSALPGEITGFAFQAIGLVTLWLGISMAGSTHNILIMVFSMVVGSIVGAFLDLDGKFRRGAEAVQRQAGTSGNFSEGFMTASLMFCMGSMAILGSIEEGMGHWPKLLLTKSVMDGVSSVAFAVTLGVGVLFSAVSVFVYQGVITLGASALQPYLTPAMLDEISAVGGVMLIGLALGVLEIKQIKIMNMLPALIVAALITAFI